MTTTNEIRTETINWLLENVGDHATLADIESALQWATDEIWQENAEIPLERGRWAIVAEAGALSVYPDPDGFGSLPKTVNKILGRVRMALRMRAVEQDD